MAGQIEQDAELSDFMGKASLPYYYLTFVIQPASSGVAQSPESLDINMWVAPANSVGW